MKHLLLKELDSEKKDIPEGEIFCVREEREKNRSAFVYTAVEFEWFWCLAIKIKGEIYMSDWLSESAERQKSRRLMAQILVIKRQGWFSTGEERLDDELGMFREPVFRCAYCGTETTDPKNPCRCRLNG